MDIPATSNLEGGELPLAALSHHAEGTETEQGSDLFGRGELRQHLGEVWVPGRHPPPSRVPSRITLAEVPSVPEARRTACGGLPLGRALLASGVPYEIRLLLVLRTLSGLCGGEERSPSLAHPRPTALSRLVVSDSLASPPRSRCHSARASRKAENVVE